MGSIQMKLQVLNGKVQIHLNTETKEAKNMLESSIQDLKHSLAAHQLSVDLVKVDVVNNVNSSQTAQNDLQNQMQNFMNQQQRDGTRQFWQQFNENFGNRHARESFFDATNIKGTTRDQALPNFDNTSSKSRVRSDGRGKSINLVA
jgi:flagellar hook-length control protein FliK